jgi:hypothetical protein
MATDLDSDGEPIIHTDSPVTYTVYADDGSVASTKTVHQTVLEYTGSGDTDADAIEPHVDEEDLFTTLAHGARDLAVSLEDGAKAGLSATSSALLLPALLILGVLALFYFGPALGAVATHFAKKGTNNA